MQLASVTCGCVAVNVHVVGSVPTHVRSRIVSLIVRLTAAPLTEVYVLNMSFSEQQLALPDGMSRALAGRSSAAETSLRQPRHIYTRVLEPPRLIGQTLRARAAARVSARRKKGALTQKQHDTLLCAACVRLSGVFKALGKDVW